MSDNKMNDFTIWNFNGIEITWQGALNWFLSLPIYGQILFIFGIVAFTVLIITGVYYLLKGIAYLIYYCLKGLYYLFKGIAFGLYKLFEGLYRLISGKPANKSQMNCCQNNNATEAKEIQKVPVQIPKSSIAQYCSQCGSEFTERMNQQLASSGMVYCVNCGNEINTNVIEIKN